MPSWQQSASQSKCVPALCALFSTALAVLPCVAEPISYEQDVRPILKTHCFHCHGEGDELAGGLDLRLRRLIASGGESGPALVAGQPDESLLAERMRSGEMPPEEISLRPSETEIATIEKWIAAGAVATQNEPDQLNPDNYITQQERDYWAFRPVRRHQPPTASDHAKVRTAVDQFVLAKLESNGLTLSQAADATTLVRRVYFDLLGLPPTPAEVDAFVSDQSPRAYERLIERVLSSPHYGERWGRHWLDVAGYADSEGYTEDDPVRPWAYKYRDYVITAFNDDMPFDQFIVEQLAGDQLVDPPWNDLTSLQANRLAATGFLRMAPDGTGIGSVDQTVARNEVMAKTIQIVSSSLLGLSVGCAQCHSHRYDPITHDDYYAFRAIFEPSLDAKNWLVPAQRRISLYTDEDRTKAAELEAEAKAVLDARTKKQAEYIEATFQRELAKLDESLHESVTAAYRTADKDRTADQKLLLKENPSVNVSAGSLYLYDKPAADDLKKMADRANVIRATKPIQEFVRAVWEPTDKKPPPTHLLRRGDPEQPDREVLPRELTVLTSVRSVEIPVDDPSHPTTGRRLAYARWLASGDHPLVARVIVNRIWLNHFGQGLVSTPAEFGALGNQPTHPELLDWLASEFVASGWSVKNLHRLIMTSTTYRQSSQRSPDAVAVDPENLLYGRMPIRRLEAESLRDAALAVSGELNVKPFGPAVPVMADRVGQFVIGKENLNAGRPGEVLPMNGEELRRSVYVQVRRSRRLSVLEPFDLPRMEPNCASRSTSTVSPQALMLMNSNFVVDRARNFAARIQREAGDDVSAQIALAWRLAFASQPTAEELAGALAFIERQSVHFPDKPAEATASFCQALLSSNHFLYID
jgi:hypothetical protein